MRDIALPRYLTAFDTDALPAEETGVLVIGGGVAGLSCAIEAARAGKRVLVITKAELAESNTRYAQGGIAAALGKSGLDGIQAHIADTMAVGDGLCNEAAVRSIISQGPATIDFLREATCAFDVSEEGELETATEAGHSRARVLHAGGDATGKEMIRALLSTALVHRTLRAYPHCFAVDLLTDGGRCAGALVFRKDELRVVFADAVVLASGGAGRLYRETSNPETATGDGHAMAMRAGAVMRDLEMVQFHPTLLYVAGAPRVLITEALRGAGAFLRNARGERFMQRYDARGELAPRDVLARAIASELRETGEAAVFLDVTHLNPSDIAVRFPGFAALCSDYDIDTSRSWVPVRPGPHYMIGGVATDLDGRTSIDGLYAAGEAACSGLHGANRLASNSLLEGVVMGRRVGALAGAARMGRPAGAGVRHVAEDVPVKRRIDFDDLRNTFRAAMWRGMGIVRDGQSLRELIRRVEGWRRLLERTVLDAPRGWELADMLELGHAMAASALFREESRGVHYRHDYPRTVETFGGRHVEYHRKDGVSLGA